MRRTGCEPRSTTTARSRSPRSSSWRCTTRRSASTPPTAGPVAAATSSRAPRWGRCSARWWRGRSTPGGSRPVDPTCGRWSRPAPAPAPWLGRCGPPRPTAPARCAACWSSGPPPSATTAPGRGRVGRADLPASIDGPVVVLANELLDNLAFDLLELHRRRLGRAADHGARRRPRRRPRAGVPGPGRPPRSRCRDRRAGAAAARRRRLAPRRARARGRRRPGGGVRLRDRPPPT